MPIAAIKPRSRSAQISIGRDVKPNIFSNPYQDRVVLAKSLFGILPATMTFEEAREGKFLEL